MNTTSKTLWPLVAAVGLGVGFVGYCVYFDRKRRNAPDFSEKLKASQCRVNLHTSVACLIFAFRTKKTETNSWYITKSCKGSYLPVRFGVFDRLFQVNTSDPDEMRRFFLEQIQQGEDCLSRGTLNSFI